MTIQLKILVVDDDAAHRLMLKTVLADEGYDITEAEDGMVAVAAVEGQFYDLILMDLKMARMDGLEAMRRIKALSPGIPVIIMTAYASVGTAVNALKSGASDYLTKPVDIDELKILIDKTLHHRRLEQENAFLKERLADRFDLSAIIGRSPAMVQLFETVALVAPSDATVLIQGESGTGKELVANAIHQNSPRSQGPFIKLNCAALPETLLESELFGHEKGSFTGATARKAGRFQLADKGSIFLDEIAEMTPVNLAPGKTLKEIEQEMILKTLEECGGNRTRAAETLGISRRTLQLKLKEYGINP